MSFANLCLRNDQQLSHLHSQTALTHVLRPIHTSAARSSGCQTRFSRRPGCRGRSGDLDAGWDRGCSGYSQVSDRRSPVADYGETNQRDWLGERVYNNNAGSPNKSMRLTWHSALRPGAFAEAASLASSSTSLLTVQWQSASKAAPPMTGRSQCCTLPCRSRRRGSRALRPPLQRAALGEVPALAARAREGRCAASAARLRRARGRLALRPVVPGLYVGRHGRSLAGAGARVLRQHEWPLLRIRTPAGRRP